MILGEGRCLGGVPIIEADKQRALAHMQTYCLMMRDTLLAEFPEFGLVRAMSVFRLPNKLERVALSELQWANLKRVVASFRSPKLHEEFLYHYPYAQAHRARTGDDHWDCWLAACKKTGSFKHPVESDSLKYSVLRGKVFLQKQETNYTPCNRNLNSRNSWCSSRPRFDSGPYDWLFFKDLFGEGPTNRFKNFGLTELATRIVGKPLVV